MDIKKYKPLNLQDIIGNEKIVNFLTQVTINNIQNILFTGDYGVGKTLFINLLIKNLKIKKKNILHINLDNDFKKNNIKDKILNFLKKKEKNFIIIDNYYEIPIEYQYIIRSFLKNYNRNTIFLISLNNINNIIEQIKNYFIVIKIKHLSKQMYFNYIKNISNKENIVIKDDILNYIIDISYNFRDIINNYIKIINSKSTNYKKILNISSKQHAINILQLCEKNDIYNAIKLIDNLINDGYSIYDIFNFLVINIKNAKINYEKKIEFIKIISLMQIKINDNNLNTYVQLCCLLSKLCQIH